MKYFILNIQPMKMEQIVFRNVGIEKSDAGEIPKGIHTRFKTRRKFEIKGTGSFPKVKSGLGVTLTSHPLLVPWSRKSRAIPLIPLWAVRPVQSLSACTRVHLTFYFFTVRFIMLLAQNIICTTI